TLRETVWALNNQSITSESFYDKFKDFAIKQSEFNIGVNLIFEEEITNNLTLKPNIALNLFRICQEAFNNSLKHSNATDIITELFSNENTFLLVIKDNGNGFDLSQKKNGHFGLENMNSRAKEIGAECSVKSDESGTSVLI